MDRTVEQARERGYVETLLGRRRYLPDIQSANGTIRAMAERNAINSPIQGSAADMIKAAMVLVWKAFSRKSFASRLILQVHDELIFDAKLDELDEIKPMIRGMVGPRWMCLEVDRRWPALVCGSLSFLLRIPTGATELPKAYEKKCLRIFFAWVCSQRSAKKNVFFPLIQRTRWV